MLAYADHHAPKRSEPLVVCGCGLLEGGGMAFAFYRGIVQENGDNTHGTIQLKRAKKIKKDNAMIPKPLYNAAQVLSVLSGVGCQLRVEDDALIVHDPKRALTDEMRDEIHKHKLAILALLLRESLLHLVQVLDMSQPTVRVGMQEEYAAALLAAMRLVGDPWAEENHETNFWQDA